MKEEKKLVSKTQFLADVETEARALIINLVGV